jgi:putative transposase
MSEKRIDRKNSLRLQNCTYEFGAYFVTIVSFKRKRIFSDPRIARTTMKTILNLREKYNFNLYSSCLMPDHFHALIGMGESGMTLSRICGDFKSLSTREFWKLHRGKLWQRQFYDHIIRNEQDFRETIRYIRLNPVRANLVKKWEDWKWTFEPDL